MAWARASPIGGLHGRYLGSASLASFPERRWIRFSPGDCKTAIPAGTCAAASIVFLSAKWRSAFGKRITSPAARQKTSPTRALPKHSKDSPRELIELCIVANFVEVFLAREGHDNPVGINYLEKIQIPHLPSLYGAMLAGVGYVLMGAGIPLKIPGVLDRLANHEPASYELQVTGAQDGDDTTITFVPRDFTERELPPLLRPKFLAIVASNTLAVTLLKKANGRVDGFVVEGPTAGGHNAPPRGKLQLNEAGEPIYGERDKVDLEKMRELGLPFWLAGGYGTAEKLREALAAGATGVQVGTAFAFCAESGLRDDYKQALLKKAISGEAKFSPILWLLRQVTHSKPRS